MENERVESEPRTPGPWETSNGPHHKGGKGSHVGRPEEWRYVQHHFPSHPYEGEFSDEWGIYPPLGEAGPVALVAGEANARLIAAAPELLRVAQLVVQATIGNIPPGIVQAARDAIEKTEQRA
jgi:hypothetical protein